MSNNKHISKETFIAFHNNNLTYNEKEQFLEHICSCDFCADQFALEMLEDIIAAPRDLKANILKASKRPDVQIAIKAKEVSKRVQLLIYSLKVCTATVCALLLLLFTMNLTDPNENNQTAASNVSTDKESSYSITTAIRDSVDKLNIGMLNFSNNLINMEVVEHDTEKK